MNDALSPRCDVFVMESPEITAVMKHHENRNSRSIYCIIVEIFEGFSFADSHSLPFCRFNFHGRAQSCPLYTV